MADHMAYIVRVCCACQSNFHLCSIHICKWYIYRHNSQKPDTQWMLFDTPLFHITIGSFVYSTCFEWFAAASQTNGNQTLLQFSHWISIALFDFQIFGHFKYVCNSNGYFEILWLWIQFEIDIDVAVSLLRYLIVVNCFVSKFIFNFHVVGFINVFNGDIFGFFHILLLIVRRIVNQIHLKISYYVVFVLLIFYSRFTVVMWNTFFGKQNGNFQNSYQTNEPE